MTLIPIHSTTQMIFPAKSLLGKYCLSPFVMIEVDVGGNIRLCGCATWMPATIGNLTNNTLEEILSSPLAQQIRQSIIDGTYQYCNEQYCGTIANNELNTLDTLPDNVKHLITDAKLFDMPHWISIQGDDTCNLSCPSCRTSVRKHSASTVKKHKQLGGIISDNLFSQPTQRTLVVHISGSGEVFASPLLLGLLSKISLDKIPNFQLMLQSNGLLAKKNWHKIKHLESTIKQVVISIDAATPDTYEVVRRGGTWKQLISAMKFFQNKKHELGFSFRTRMVVQNRNWQEIQQFYDFSRSFDVDRIEYSKITDWKSWPTNQWQEHNVFDPTHSNYSAVKDAVLAVQKLPGVWCHGIF